MHPGGLYLLKGVGSATARGTFREVVPVHRLAYSFGWEGNEEVSPGSGLIEIDLIEQDGGTLLRMTHSGLPSAAHASQPCQRLGALSRQADQSRRRPGSRARSGTERHAQRVRMISVKARIAGDQASFFNTVTWRRRRISIPCRL